MEWLIYIFVWRQQRDQKHFFPLLFVIKHKKKIKHSSGIIVACNSSMSQEKEKFNVPYILHEFAVMMEELSLLN